MVNDWDDDFDQDEAASETLETLVDLNHPALQDVLAEVVNHPSRHLRYQAALKLAELFQDTRAAPTLAEAINDRDRATQKAAANALWDIGDTDADGLIALLDRSYGSARDRLTNALERIGWAPDDSDSEVAYRIVARQWRVCVAMGEAAVPALICALSDHDGNTRRAAAWALGQIGDKRAVPDLARLLYDTSGDLFGEGNRVCDVAAQSLELIGTEEALEALADWQSGDY